MLHFKEISLEHLTVHHVGNKTQDELLQVSDNELDIQDELILELLMKYFLKPFKDEVFYQFTHESDLNLNEIYHYASSIFENPDSFHVQSINTAKHLFEVATHPNIKGGEFYMIYLSDCRIGDEYMDAIGLFKSENKETYLKVYEESKNFNIESESGININKLDKGCLIFNTQKESGYKICVVDNVNKGNEAQYWIHDFLRVKKIEDSFYHTQNALDMCKNFCEEVLTPENSVNKTEQLYMMDKSLNFFNENETFDSKQFEEEIMQAPELIDAFQEYKQNYAEEKEVQLFDEFDISQPAIKTQKKYFKSILKLDKNFTVYIHGNHEMIERGFDDDRKMNYYRLYFTNES